MHPKLLQSLFFLPTSAAKTQGYICLPGNHNYCEHMLFMSCAAALKIRPGYKDYAGFIEMCVKKWLIIKINDLLFVCIMHSALKQL